MKKLIGGIIISLALFGFSFQNTFASEGVAELRNNLGGPSRCFATSVLMPDFNYNILITCRDLIYPVTSEVLKYVVWASPTSGGDPIKFGEIGFGKVFFRTPTAFANIFITQERNGDIRKPSGATAMSGNIKTISFLEEPSSVTPSLPSDETPIPTPVNTTSNNNGGLLSVFRTGAVVTVISIFLIILMLILVKPFK